MPGEYVPPLASIQPLSIFMAPHTVERPVPMPADRPPPVAYSLPVPSIVSEALAGTDTAAANKAPFSLLSPSSVSRSDRSESTAMAAAYLWSSSDTNLILRSLIVRLPFALTLIPILVVAPLTVNGVPLVMQSV